MADQGRYLATSFNEALINTDSNQAFRVIYEVASDTSDHIRLRKLQIAEALGLKHFTPTHCAQKRLVHALNLPWSTSTHTRAYTQQ